MNKNSVGRSEKIDPPHPIDSPVSVENKVPLPLPHEPQFSKNNFENSKNFSENFVGSLPIIGQVDPLHDPKNIQARVDAFNKELSPLLGKYNLTLGGEAFIFNGLVAAKPVVAEYVEPKKEIDGTKS